MFKFIDYLLALALLITLATPNISRAQDSPESLIGTWRLDMSPENSEDNNFAMMEITAVKGRSFSGTFYREGVAIRSGLINTQTGKVYGALISGDGTGEYYTSFYLEDGRLVGTTHAPGRNFLSTWIANKVEDE
ncbi:hypothetical protein SAMN04490243_2605 [Robiginitalea myxolifaciens]|uniref:Extracellular endo-alpha-(1->5)-L-arabinanase C-terminal domain-containing protein n=1 Tax=Robiginitalea myxolifaciens TaxID=400055 RepID=A0A1I6HDH7_9FLAO|nr:hypothetical protein [Robiginitalea myxolifaciens]SFR52555.1 hypothetical protein SAMN04490243_2605 [Robiginitalea myxolifaciens]